MDEDALVTALERFGGSPAERQAVARAARDLADSGRLAADTDGAISIERVTESLSDAPDGGPADRWNWWIGALELAYDGYAEFQVRQWREAEDAG